MTEKEKIRKEIKEKLNATSEDYRKEASAKIALNALNIPEMKEQKRTSFLGLKKTEKTVLAYCSVGNEPSTLAKASFACLTNAFSKIYLFFPLIPISAYFNKNALYNIL